MLMDVNIHDLARLSRDELIERAKAKRQLYVIQSRRDCTKSLVEFVKQAWHIVEPANPYVHGWHVDAVAMHLEAVNDGEVIRLLVNIPPGMMKSLLTSVFFPAWVWGPQGKPETRFLCTSHSLNLAIRDSLKMRQCESPAVPAVTPRMSATAM